MDKLQALQVFVTVVKENSFAIAAERLDLSPPMVSRYIAWLEKSLSSRLINRTTRSFSLTETGTLYFRHAIQILDALEEADMTASEQKEDPRGTLRISASPPFGQKQLMPLIVNFLKQYPHINIELSLDDRLVNLVEEGFDLGIRITQKLDPGLVARTLCACQSVLCASPDYLKRFGTPRTYSDLSQHQCLIFPFFLNRVWQFQIQNKTVGIEVKGRLQINNINALVSAAIAGMGITYQPTYLIRDTIRSGELTIIHLDDCMPIEPSIYAIYPSREYLPSKVRKFIDLLVETYSPVPPWDK